MQRQRLFVYAALLVAWVAFSLGQYRNYSQQRDLVNESLRQQARSIMTAIVGGLRSHRRLGRFFQEQLQGMVDELVESKDVIAVSLLSSDGDPVISAGALGGHVERDVFELNESFKLSPPGMGPPGMGRGGMGGVMGADTGPGRGGRGFGGRRWEGEPREGGLFSEGGTFSARLLLDRTRANTLERRIAWSHALATAAAGFVALCIGFVFRATVNLAEAKGRERVYKAEARHLREMSQAAAGLAHETRNPLGLIRGWMQRLSQSKMSEDDRLRYAHAVIEECDRVTSRINQFLAFARPRRPEVADVDVGSLFQELAVILEPDIESNRLELTRDVEPRVAWLRADSELLRQAVFNLIQNALQSSPEHRDVSLVARLDPSGTASIQIADHGPGVPEESIESLFTPYFTTRPDGTGLGLAIVRHIATLHGWIASYEPRPGGGAVFRISGIDVAEHKDDSDR